VFDGAVEEVRIAAKRRARPGQIGENTVHHVFAFRIHADEDQRRDTGVSQTIVVS
jgi:hypothetical protein